jgi:hypothetical protein
MYISFDHSRCVDAAMKTWSQMLKKILNALAFANAGNLGECRRMLRQDESLSEQGVVRALAPAIKKAKRLELVELRHPHERVS